MQTLEEVIDALPDVSTIEKAAVFLSQICPAEITELSVLPTRFPSPEAFAAMMLTFTSLHNLVKTSHSEKDFTNFWRVLKDRLGYFKTYSFTSTTAFSEALSEIARVRTDLLELLHGRLPLAVWKADNNGRSSTDILEPLGLIKASSYPALELWQLGCFKDIPEQQSKVTALFQPHVNSFLMNASGTGKTRLLLEGLSQHWGIYITAFQDPSSIGSKIMGHVVTRFIRSHRTIAKPLPNSNISGSIGLQQHNSAIVRRYCNSVLLAHLLLLDAYLKLADEVRPTASDTKQDWLKLHAFPSTLGLPDIVTDIYGCLIKVSEDQVQNNIKYYCDEICRRCGEPVFIVLDEANALARMLQGSFRDSAGNDVSVLAEIVRIWRETLTGAVAIIVAGTDIPKECFRGDEWSSFRWTSNTGSFTDRASQRDYIRGITSHVPSSIQFSDALVNRLWSWLRYRYRFTAVFFAVQVLNGFKHPHYDFCQLVLALSGYELHSSEFVAREPRPSQEGLPYRYSPFSLSFENIKKDCLLITAIQEVLFSYLVTGQHPPYFTYDRVDLVRFGMGRFIDGAMNSIAMDEPMMLHSAITWMFTEREDTSEVECGGNTERSSGSLIANMPLQELLSINSEQPHNPACLVAWYIANAFTQRMKPHRVFSFAKPEPIWAKYGAQLVMLRRSPLGQIHQIPLDSSSLRPDSPPLAVRANTKEDVMSFLRIEKSAFFCICPDTCKADLILAMRVRSEKLIWVFIQCRGKEYSALDASSVLEDLMPENLFSTSLVPTASIRDCLNTLPNPVTSHPFLRVVTNLAKQFELSTTPAAQRRQPSSPTASLRFSTFENAILQFDRDNIRRGIIASATFQRTQHSELFEMPEKPHKRSPRKRKELQQPTRKLRSGGRELTKLRPLSHRVKKSMPDPSPFI